MNFKLIVIIVIAVLVIVSVRTEFTEEQRFCYQFSGQSSTDSASEAFMNCENASLCKVIKVGNSNEDVAASAGVFTYTCVHIDTEESTHPQKYETLQ